MLTLAGCQVPFRLLCHSPSSVGQGGENMTKASWVEVGTERGHSAITVTGRTDLTLGK